MTPSLVNGGTLRLGPTHETEIGELHQSAGAEKNVGRFHVPMAELPRVGVNEGTTDLSRHDPAPPRHGRGASRS